MFLLYALALSFHAGVNVTAAPTTMSLMDSYVQRRSDGEVGGLHLTAVLIAQLAHSDAARLERAVRKKGGGRESKTNPGSLGQFIVNPSKTAQSSNR